MSDYEQKLEVWSKKVVAYCQKVATNPDLELDLAFYAFQSASKEKPDLLLIGTNPGKDFGYNGKMTVEKFQEGNEFYYTHETWPLWKRLSVIFQDTKNKNILSDCMYMNLCYFNTTNIANLRKRTGGTDAIKKCKEFSLELINDIIKPKNILCLGTASCFDLMKLQNRETILKPKKNRLLVKGDLNGIQVYGVPHPSGSRVSNEDLQSVGKWLESKL